MLPIDGAGFTNMVTIILQAMDEECLIDTIRKARDEDIDDPQAQGPQISLQVSIDELQELLDFQLGNAYKEDRDDDIESEASSTSVSTIESTQPEPEPEPKTIRLIYPDDSVPLKYPSSASSSSHKSTHDDFVLAFALWCIIFDVSRPVYTALLQVLRLLPRDPSGLIDAFERVPETIETLKKQATSQLPLLELRSKNIPLNPEKLSTMRRHNAGLVDEDANIDSASEANTTIKQGLYFFNPVSLFKTILSSSFVSRMHFGMALLVDSPTTFWHSSSWAQSIRATSGEFARFPSGKPIFPSDFVRYRCASNDPCNCQSNDDDKLHLGRVREVWKEGRVGRTPGIKINVLPVLPLRDILKAGVVTAQNLSIADKRLRGFPEEPFNEACEYVILIRPPDQVPEGNVVTAATPQIRFRLDTSYGSSVRLPEDHSVDHSSMDWPNILIRRTFDIPTLTFSPLGRMDPIAGELEIETYGRRRLEERFAGTSPVKSMPTTIFNDGFGLYRHMHKSIEGIYIFLGNLQPTEANWQVNVFPLTLGPHGSNPKDVVEAIRPYWASLEEGLVMPINGEDNVVCAFNLAFRADMPQQQDNSGMLRQLANRGCRHCDVSKVERSHISDKWTQPPRRRSHYEVQRQRKVMEMKRTPREKATYGSTIGMATEPSPLEMWSPALDVIITRPSDAAHSEYAGITKMTHLLLIDQVWYPHHFSCLSNEAIASLTICMC